MKLVVSGRLMYVDCRRNIRNNNVFILLILPCLIWEFKESLTVIDVYSKYGWIVPLKTKTGIEVVHAFPKLFHNGHPSMLVYTSPPMILLADTME